VICLIGLLIICGTYNIFVISLKKTTMFHCYAALVIFSQFLSEKQPSSNILLDLEYFCNFSRKNDYVPIFAGLVIFLTEIGKIFQVQQNIGT